MGEKRITRYFIFSIIEPTSNDYRLLIETCQIIDACYGYRTDCGRSEKILKGFIILRGARTHIGCLSKAFVEIPGFSLMEVQREFDLDFDEIPRDVVFKGGHPYKDLRRDLFGRNILSSLSVFFVSGSW